MPRLLPRDWRYTKPFTIKVTHLLQADTDILEYFCNENEKDRGHLGLK